MTVGSSLMYTKAATFTTILITLKSQAWDQWKVNRRLLRQFIQCCSGPPKDSRFVQPTTVYETPQAVSTCFDGSSSAVTHMAQHACATACSNWSTSLDCVRFLLLTSAEGSFGSCPSFCSVPFLCANSHGIDLRPACPRSFA